MRKSLLWMALLAELGACVQIGRTRQPDPSSWQLVGPSEADKAVSFSIALHGEREAELEGKMLEIAENRGEWLSSEELAGFVAPSADVKRALEDHLVEQGVEREGLTYNELGNVLSVEAKVGSVGQLLNTTLSDYRDLQTGEIFVKTTQAHLPAGISENVASIDTITSFHRPSKRPPRRPVSPTSPPLHARASLPTASSAPHQAPPGCNSNNNSYPCIAQFYGYDGYTPPENSESVAVMALGGLWTDSSLHSFTKAFRQDASKANYLPNQLNLQDPSAWTHITQDDPEDVMDIEILTAIAYPLNLSSIATQLDWTSFVQALIDLPSADRPGLVSVSYGIQESDTDAAYSATFCQRVQQLTALGTTFLTGSGDNGVAVNNASACPPFQVDMMSACPYVLSVGATTGLAPERAVFLRDQPDNGTNGWSSGGFSNFHPMPSYQKGHADTYLSSLTNPPPSQDFNASGRGFPDVAAFGEFINEFENGGYDIYGGGTSASGPIVASMLGMVNAKCKAKGKPRVGWVHPTFYAHPEAFNDITVGGAFDCADTDFGFPCKAGWDPATGLGSLDFGKVVQVFGCG